MQKKLLVTLDNSRIKHKNDVFLQWLDKIVIDNRLRDGFDKTDVVSNKDIVNEMLMDIDSLLNKHDYKIKDTKAFRNETATYVYNETA